jgi:NADPH:quinone reductase-like Zn-dependent oxidoreductase
MRNIAVLGGGLSRAIVASSLHPVVIDGVTVTFGCIRTPDLPFCAAGESSSRNAVLVRKRAFSLNYRDRRSILLAALRGSPNGYYVLGSDFSGDVVEAGPGVTAFRTGDRVMGNSSYQDAEGDTGMPGLASRHASREFEMFDPAKLARIPDSMPYETAAAFGINAQTAQAMIRRLQIRKGSRILVTAARSNTALFAISMMRSLGVQVFAATTSNGFERQFCSMGVACVVNIDKESTSFHLNSERTFEYVIDPFFDIYFAASLEVMAKGGRYITCGILDQCGDLIATGRGSPQWGVRQTVLMLVRNLEIMGNCIGTTADLHHALRQYATGRLQVPIDSVWTGDQIGEFVDRTYNAPDRFGKVVYKYE